MQVKILIVDDDRECSALLHSFLSDQGYEIQTAFSPQAAIHLLQKRLYDVVLLDTYFHGEASYEVIEFIRTANYMTSILMVSQFSHLDARILALQKGVDDFLPKPFHPVELRLKIEKLLQRKHASLSNFSRTGYFWLNLLSGELHFPHRVIRLRKKEFELLSYLIQHRNTPVKKELLLEWMWSIDEMPILSTVDVHIGRLRAKIGDRKKQVIQTVYGMGYMFKDLPKPLKSAWGIPAA